MTGYIAILHLTKLSKLAQVNTMGCCSYCCWLSRRWYFSWYSSWQFQDVTRRRGHFHSLHLRLVHPLSDGIVADLDATRSFLNYLREKSTLNGREIYCVIGIPAVADGDAKTNFKKLQKVLLMEFFLFPNLSLLLLV